MQRHVVERNDETGDFEQGPEPTHDAALEVRATSRPEVVVSLRGLCEERLVRPADALLLSSERRFVSAGVPEIDALIGGGFPRGRIAEIVGPPSSGRTALLLSAVARVTSGGEVAAWIDPASSLDPRVAAEAGVHLPHLLWVRPRTRSIAWTAADVVLGTPGFALVIVDVCGAWARPAPHERHTNLHKTSHIESHMSLRITPPMAEAPPRGKDPERVAASVWPRLARAAERAGTALVLLGDTHLAGTFAALTLELEPAGRAWCGVSLPSAVLAGSLARARIVRNKLGPPDRETWVSFGEADATLAQRRAATPHRLPVRGGSRAAGGAAR